MISIPDRRRDRRAARVSDRSQVDSSDVPRRTEARVVRLNLDDAAQVRTAYAEILASAKTYAPRARIGGVSVQEMVREGVEVIIGVSCDPLLGPVLLFACSVVAS
jgi:acetyltransferase